MRFIRKAGAPVEKSPRKLLVEPAELARKLVKEMDDHATVRGDQVLVRGRYTLYLCPEDYENLLPRVAQLTADFKSKLTKHVESMEYVVQGDLTVELVPDEELELGYFGILAQKAAKVARPSGAPAASPGPSAPAPAGAPAPVRAPTSASTPAAPVDAGAPPARVARPEVSGATEVLPADEAEEMRLEGRVIVVTSGDQVMQFRQSRVIVGRSKEADLRVNDPNVSRKHAAIYWNNGRIMIDDLGSTNGTMVNGYPVTRTMLRATDVIAIGESRLTVEGK